ncbi:hypothetical protein ACJJTC_008641 [Scirpophaga incertulas]
MADSAEHLQDYINSLNASCCRFGLVISVKKTEILIQPPRGCARDSTNIRLDNNILNIAGKILEKRNELFRVGTPFGIISDLIPRNAVSSPNTIISGDIPQNVLKIHMLHAHLDKFKDNLGAYSEVQEERFHQDVMNFEKCYQGQYNENMMGDYIWGLLNMYQNNIFETCSAI